MGEVEEESRDSEDLALNLTKIRTIIMLVKTIYISKIMIWSKLFSAMLVALLFWVSGDRRGRGGGVSRWVRVHYQSIKSTLYGFIIYYR